jgi:flagellum-specific ATP synthase
MLDEAIRLHPTMEAFLMQAMDESFDLDDTRQLLDSVLVS